MRDLRNLMLVVIVAVTLNAPALAAPRIGYFTPNLRLKSQTTSVVLQVKDVEPSLRVDSTGRIFVSAIHGVPGGTDLFQVFPASTPGGGTFTYLGMPDGLPVNICPISQPLCNQEFAPGGGDTDLAIGSFNPRTPGQPGPLLITSLNLVTVYSSEYTGGTPRYIPGGNASGVPVGLDRQWNNANGGLERYNVVHDAATDNIQFAKSLDGGIIWINGTPTTTGAIGSATINNAIGPIVVDQNRTPQTLYNVFVSVHDAAENVAGKPLHTIWVSHSSNDGLTWTPVIAYNEPCPTTCKSLAHLFPSIAVDAWGNVYAVWSDDANIFMTYSIDKGNTWSSVVQVTNSVKDGGYKTHIFPWIAAGFKGGVDIVYYETTGATPDLTTNTWQVGMAQNYHVLSNPADFVYYTASDHVIHTGPVCENGIGCNSTSPGNRNLADDFQVAIDPGGLANIAFTDDHDHTIAPQTYFTKQVWGYQLGTPNGDGPNRGCSLYGTTLPPSGNAGTPVVVRLKAPVIGSQGWFTLVQNGAVLVAGPVTTFAPSSPTVATFTGTGMRGGAFSGSIQNGTLQLVFNGTVVRAALTSGVTAFE